MEINDIYDTRNCGKLRIVSYRGYHNVEVEFLATGYRTITEKGHILKGQVKDRFYPSVWGVGFIGEGYKKSDHQKAYTCWSQMLERCYSIDYHEMKPTYLGCFVAEVWHNFQNFVLWYIENFPKTGVSYHLDKDIKIDGNKEYSPETCLFVTPRENTVKALAKSYSFVSPEGCIINIYNLREFCKENSLHAGHMGYVHRGLLTQHKGWTNYAG